MDYPKISVSIIAYKQEDLIRRSLDSIIAQKDYVYEICVFDDCSPDNTSQVVEEYAEANPGLIRLFKRSQNGGVFENIERSWDCVTGDIVYQLAGDDESGDGWFKAVTEYIVENNIDYKNELFCIYGDFVAIDPAGRRCIHKNDLAISGKNMMSLALRGLVCNRSACYSIGIVKKFFKVSQGRSHIAESAMDRQLQLFSEKNYYIPKVGNVYYTGIGITTMIINGNTFKERQQINPYLIQTFSDKGYTPSKADLLYMSYIISFWEFFKHRTVINFIDLFWRWLLSYDPAIGIRSLNFPFIFRHIIRFIR